MSGTISERVDAGWKWLDEHKPGWQESVVVNKLDMMSRCKCVLGQVFGDNQRNETGFGYARPLMTVRPHELGFDAIGFTLPVEDFMLLQAEWTRRLVEWQEQQGKQHAS